MVADTEKGEAKRETEKSRRGTRVPRRESAERASGEGNMEEVELEKGEVEKGRAAEGSLGSGRDVLWKRGGRRDE